MDLPEEVYCARLGHRASSKIWTSSFSVLCPSIPRCLSLSLVFAGVSPYTVKRVTFGAGVCSTYIWRRWGLDVGHPHSGAAVVPRNGLSRRVLGTCIAKHLPIAVLRSSILQIRQPSVVRYFQRNHEIALLTPVLQNRDGCYFAIWHCSLFPASSGRRPRGGYQTFHKIVDESNGAVLQQSGRYYGVVDLGPLHRVTTDHVFATIEDQFAEQGTYGLPPGKRWSCAWWVIRLLRMLQWQGYVFSGLPSDDLELYDMVVGPLAQEMAYAGGIRAVPMRRASQ
ncbi:hypothetical protein EDD15DRAFT_2308770 [Pisolithus albus]|nr:hypothetical protein EDD15DRAFT_2308770 [Pisolithus albus]